MLIVDFLQMLQQLVLSLKAHRANLAIILLILQKLIRQMLFPVRFLDMLMHVVFSLESGGADGAVESGRVHVEKFVSAETR